MHAANLETERFGVLFLVQVHLVQLLVVLLTRVEHEALVRRAEDARLERLVSDALHYDLESLVGASLLIVLLQSKELGLLVLRLERALLSDFVFQPLRVVVHPLVDVFHRFTFGVKLYQFFKLMLDFTDQLVVGRFFIKLQCEYTLGNFPQILGYHLEEFTHVLDVDALPQKILEGKVGILKLLVEL